jgi:long-chain acyl-CoA synthetase
MEDRHLAAMIAQSCRQYGDRIAMRYKSGEDWQAITYRELGKRIQHITAALIKMGVQAGDRVGIFSQNRTEWAITDFAILSVDAVTVPIYATNTSSQTEYIVRDAGLKVIFVGDTEQYEKVRAFADKDDLLRHIILFDTPASGFPERGRTCSFESLLEQALPAGVPGPLAAKHPSDTSRHLASIIYTSGTTGDPKGVMLSHGNFFHQIDAVNANFHINTEDRSLCFLPLSHVYERIWSYIVFHQGAQNHYIKNPREVLPYLEAVKPTAMVSVPRLYEKIHAAIMDRLEKAPAFRKHLFSWATGVGRQWANARRANRQPGLGLKIRHGLADRLVFRKIREIVGGDKNFFSAGGAPLAREIEEFFLDVGLLICQGYGLTETAPMISYNTPRHFKFGTVGRPAPGCRVRIAADGEIQVQGPNVMLGYYNNPEATEAVFDNGWFRTGDVGMIDAEGFLVVTDRIKDLIITSGGKNIAPQRIETAVGKDHYIEQITTIGDRRKFISALIVPSFEAIENVAREKGIAYHTREDLVKNPDIISFFRERIAQQSSDLAGYETIKRFTLLSREFSQDSGEITPTQKVRRNVIEQHFGPEIEAMYPED